MRCFARVLPATLALLPMACAASVHRSPPASRPPLVVQDARDARPAVAAGRVVRAMVLGGGALRVDPAPAGRPRLSEPDALRLLRASGSPDTLTPVSDVVVGFGTVTLHTPVTATGLIVRPIRLPAFTRRPAWFAVYESGPTSCPSLPRSSPPGRPAPRGPLPVELLAADGTREGVAFATSGAVCEGPVLPATAVPASFALSLPWTVSRDASGTPAVVAAAPPRCGTISSVARSGSTRPGVPGTLAVGAEVLLVSGRCRGGMAPPPLPAGPSVLGLQHVPTGLTRAMVTAFRGTATHFTYDDGIEHTLTP